MVYSLKNICKNTATLLTQSRLISRTNAVKMIVTLEDGHMPGQIKFVTSVVKNFISRKNAGQQEMVIVVTHLRSQ